MPQRAYTEDTPLDLANIVVSDVDSANVTATLTLSAPAAGSLNTATSGAVTSTYQCQETGLWTASGAIANVNTLLAGVDVYSGAELQQQLYHRHQRQRRRSAGDHRYENHDRHRSQRRAGQHCSRFPIHRARHVPDI